jgi:hypothetical protein
LYVQRQTSINEIHTIFLKKRWIDEPNQFFRLLGVDNPEELANERVEWRRLCGAVMGLNGLQ